MTTNIKLLAIFFLLPFSVLAQRSVKIDSVEVEGYYRTFRYNVPAADLKGASLLFVMHGSGGNSEGAMRQTTRLEAASANEKLLIVYPDGYKHFWNECRLRSNAEANKININENSFFQDMIEYFQLKYGIDTKKVFAVGFSGGGHMAYKLALTMPDRFRAVCAIVANMPDSASMDCQPVRKAIPILIINGTKDSTNPYLGGEMFVNNASFGVVRSTEQSFHYWASLAGYTGDPVMAKLPDTNPGDQKTIESYTYKQAGKPEVQLLKVIGGRHDYPGDIDTYSYVWEFFKRQ